MLIWRELRLKQVQIIIYCYFTTRSSNHTIVLCKYHEPFNWWSSYIRASSGKLDQVKKRVFNAICFTIISDAHADCKMCKKFLNLPCTAHCTGAINKHCFNIEAKMFAFPISFVTRGHLRTIKPGVYKILLLPAALLLFIWSTAANEFELYLLDTFN